MAIIKKPTPSEMALARLRAIYLKAEQDIIREITRKRDLGLVDYGEVASLQRVQGILQNMNTKAEEYVPKMVETYFYTAEQQASAPAGYANALTLTSTQTDIAETLVGNLLADITEASKTAYESAEEYLRIGRQEAGLIRQTTLELLTQGEASGKGWRTVQNQMAAELNAKGVTAFVDKAGRKWSLESYCSMATRTTGRQAQVAAALTSDDWDLWQISKIGSTCPLCSVYEGRVYSKSGTDPDYPPLAMAFGKIDPAGSNDLSNTWLNIHPNCLHSLVRYTTAGKSDKQIQAEKDFSSFEKRPADVDYRTKKQIEAYRKKEADRARYRADVKQFEKYKAAGVEGMPVRFETFEKHKRAGDDVYKGWESKFRGLNSQAKRIENELKGGIITSKGISGAVSGALNPLGDKADKHAKRYYNEIRKRTSDVKAISKTTGLSEETVQSIKNYVFIDEHDLGDGIISRFMPDYMMAESWRRLIEGSPVPHDLTLLNHEMLEQKLITEGLSQAEAHKVASQTFNYGKEASEYYGKIKKYRKE